MIWRSLILILLVIRGHRIRLFGIDAPEGRQRCKRDGRAYRCDQQAVLALAFIGIESVRGCMSDPF